MEKDKKSTSAKMSVKERRAAQAQQQQRNQQILIMVGAVVLLILVVGVIFLSTRPVEAKINSDTLTYYKPYEDKGFVGVTSEGFPYIGKSDAPTTIKSIESFSCPICLRFHDAYFTNLRDKLLDGSLKFVYIPVTSTGDFDSL